ncbi:MAG: arginine--tRNA ligase [bacterium]|nr:arginine--tRNA ligase [bacterium]
MNLYTHFGEQLTGVLEALREQGVLPLDADFSRITVEPPRDPSHGDIATNAAMVLAKMAKMPPRDLAKKITELLLQLDDVKKAEIAGPGFINISITALFWQKILIAAFDNEGLYGRSQLGQGQKINVEFVSANPTGPMHVGHVRGAVFGDALANLLDFTGFDVSREYYINDAGAQVDVLARSAYLRYLEALGEEIGDIPEGLYPGDYLKAVGADLAEKHGDEFKGQEESQWLETIRDFAIDAMMDQIRGDLKTLNITFDQFFSERSLKEGDVNMVAQSIEDLRDKGLIYEGTLPPPKGKLPDDWEDREQTLFRATDFGDDVDRALAKADGSHTYFASDIAYHRDKYMRGFTSMIDVLGADHSGYIKRMKAAVKALSDGEAELDVKICQLVKLLRGGKPVKMGKRLGTFITLREVVDEVGSDVVRFIMLYRKNDASLDFDFYKVQEQSKDNPVFYVQYAHARVHSVLYRKIPLEMPDLDIADIDPLSEDLSLLVDSGEVALVKRLAQYPRIIEQAAKAHEPHRVAFYLYELAADLHMQWSRGTEKPELRFISDGNKKVTGARAVLLLAIAKTLASGLGILGVHPIEEMR